jgi:hypothetical protein
MGQVSISTFTCPISAPSTFWNKDDSNFDLVHQYGHHPMYPWHRLEEFVASCTSLKNESRPDELSQQQNEQDYKQSGTRSLTCELVAAQSVE